MEEIIIRILLIIVFSIEIYLFFKKKNKYEFLINELFWIIAPWTICLLLYYLLGIDYYIKLRWTTLAYIICFWMCYFIGKYIVNLYVNKGKKQVVENDEEKVNNEKFKEKINLFPLFVVAFICVIIYSVYVISINKINFGSTRNVNTNAISTFFLIFSSSSLVIWLYELAFALLNDKKITYYGWISAIIYNIPCLIISGRDALMIFLISTFITFVYCGNYSRKVLKNEGKTYLQIKKISLVFICIMLIYLVFLTGNRYGKAESSALGMFETVARCKFPKYLKDIYYNLGGFGKLILNTVFYYTSQFSKLELIFNQYNGPYIGGLFQLHYISRLLPKSWNLDFSVVTSQIAQITKNANVEGLKGFWETFIGYSIYDFGKIGTIVFSFILGILVKKLQLKYNSKNDVISLVFNIFIGVAMFLTIEISPIFDYYYIFPLIWCCIILNIEKIKRTYLYIKNIIVERIKLIKNAK